jgi:hypothetical protein
VRKFPVKKVRKIFKLWLFTRLVVELHKPGPVCDDDQATLCQLWVAFSTSPTTRDADPQQRRSTLRLLRPRLWVTLLGGLRSSDEPLERWLLAAAALPPDHDNTAPPINQALVNDCLALAHQIPQPHDTSEKSNVQGEAAEEDNGPKETTAKSSAAAEAVEMIDVGSELEQLVSYYCATCNVAYEPRLATILSTVYFCVVSLRTTTERMVDEEEVKKHICFLLITEL